MGRSRGGRLRGPCFSFWKKFFKVKVPDLMFLKDHLGFPPYPPDSLPQPPGRTGLRADRLPHSHLPLPTASADEGFGRMFGLLRCSHPEAPGNPLARLPGMAEGLPGTQLSQGAAARAFPSGSAPGARGAGRRLVRARGRLPWSFPSHLSNWLKLLATYILDDIGDLVPLFPP